MGNARNRVHALEHRLQASCVSRIEPRPRVWRRTTATGTIIRDGLRRASRELRGSRIARQRPLWVDSVEKGARPYRRIMIPFR